MNPLLIEDLLIQIGNLSLSNVTDKCVSKLVNVHTLDLSNTRVTDTCVPN